MFVTAKITLEGDTSKDAQIDGVNLPMNSYWRSITR